ncbi:MAG: sigma-70 family RNA polymerase sigma factor [Actinomycetota bacterium]
MRAATASPRLEALFRREYDGMVRLAFALVSDLAEAEEVVQDAFVDVAERLDDLREPGGYLRVAVVSRSRSLLRRRAVRRRRPPPLPDEVPPEADELWDVLADLPEQQRSAIVLRYYGGYRASEIADLLDCPAATVRSWLRRGLRSLQEALS